MSDSSKEHDDKEPDERPADAPDDAYRDDPSALARSSDYAQGGTTGRYAGEGPGDTPAGDGGIGGQRGNNAGSQEDWRGRPDGQAAPSGPQQASSEHEAPKRDDEP